MLKVLRFLVCNFLKNFKTWSLVSVSLAYSVRNKIKVKKFSKYKQKRQETILAISFLTFLFLSWHIWSTKTGRIKKTKTVNRNGKIKNCMAADKRRVYPWRLNRQSFQNGLYWKQFGGSELGRLIQRLIVRRKPDDVTPQVFHDCKS